MNVSVVVPVYNAVGTIETVVNGLFQVFAIDLKLQVVLVNDGSVDGSDSVCLALSEKYPDVVTYVDLAKNFGEHNAVMAGLRHSVGDYVVIMDDDMQNLPEDARKLYEEAREKRFDILYSKYVKKEHSLFRNMGSWFNGWAAGLLLGKPKNLYLSSFKCLSRSLTKEVIRYEGPYPYVDGLALRSTRHVGCLEVDHRPRVIGQSGYNFQKLIRLWLNMSVNFSILPLRLSGLSGFLLVVCAMGLIADVLWEKWRGTSIPSGWAFMAIVTILFSGVQLLMLGVIGEYLGRLYLSANQTPQYVVKSVHGFTPSGATGMSK